jgi:osmotically-inducible protein OsmY
MGTFSKKVGATLLACILLGGGCSKHQNDEAIAQDVQSKLATDPVAKGSAVSVSAKDGKVTLKGTVKDPATQQRVEQTAREEREPRE